MDNILGLIGLAKKAGRLEAGNDLCKEAVYEQKTRLVLIASNAAERVVRDFERIKEEYNFFILFVPYTKEELASVAASASCAVCAVTDINFAAEIAHKMADLTKGENEIYIAERLALSKKRKRERESKKASEIGELHKHNKGNNIAEEKGSRYKNKKTEDKRYQERGHEKKSDRLYTERKQDKKLSRLYEGTNYRKKTHEDRISVKVYGKKAVSRYSKKKSSGENK